MAHACNPSTLGGRPHGAFEDTGLLCCLPPGMTPQHSLGFHLCLIQHPKGGPSSSSGAQLCPNFLNLCLQSLKIPTPRVTLSPRLPQSVPILCFPSIALVIIYPVNSNCLHTSPLLSPSRPHSDAHAPDPTPRSVHAALLCPCGDHLSFLRNQLAIISLWRAALTSNSLQQRQKPSSVLPQNSGQV